MRVLDLSPQVLGRCGFQWWDNFSPPSSTYLPRYQGLDNESGIRANPTPFNHLEYAQIKPRKAYSKDGEDCFQFCGAK